MKKRITLQGLVRSIAGVQPGTLCSVPVILLLAACGAHGDILILKNGNKMEGVITEERPDSVQFEELGIKLWIKKSKIQTIQQASARDRSRQVEQLKAEKKKKGVLYPNEVRHVLAGLRQLDAKKAERKQLAASIRTQIQAHEAMEKKIINLRKELNTLSEELTALRPSDDRNQFGGRPIGYYEQVRAYNTRFPDYQKLHSEVTALSTKQLTAEKKLAEQSRKLTELAGQYAESRKQTGQEWKAFMDAYPSETLDRGEWFLSIGRKLQDHTEFGPVDPSKKVVVRKTDEGVQVIVQADRWGQFLIPVVLNRKSAVNVIVDTGAAMTLVSREMAEKAGLTLVGESFEATLADGKKVKVRQAVAESMGIFGVIYPDEKIAVMEGDVGEGFDGLLGMTFLKKVPFTIRNRTLVITL